MINPTRMENAPENQPQTQPCKECGNDFTIEPHEVKFYAEKGWPLPKRCKRCRVRRKNEQDAASGQPGTRWRDDRQKEVREEWKARGLRENE